MFILIRLANEKLIMTSVLLVSLIIPLISLAAPLVEVVVTGIEGAESDNVLQHLTINQQKDHPDLTEGRIRRLHVKANQEIAKALQPFGYYRPAVESELTYKDGLWRASYRIDPGPPVPIKALDISIVGQGAKQEELLAILRDAPLRKDETLHQPHYSQLKKDLQRAAERLGYFDASFVRHQVQIDLKKYEAAIDLAYDTGARYRFGAIELSGDTALDENFIRRFITFKQGDFFRSAVLREVQGAMAGSDYFSQVNIRVERDRIHDYAVPVTIHVSMRHRTRYSLGLGYGTDTGARGRIGMDRRFVNRKGHRFGTELKVSQIRQSIDARYTIPLERPQTDRVTYRTEFSQEEIENIESKAVLVESFVERLRTLWRWRYGLGYQVEDFSLGAQQGTSQLLIPSIAWQRIISEGTLHTYQGNRIGIELRGAEDAMLSDTDFLQARVQGKYIMPLDAGRLITRAEIGTTHSRQFDQLPPSVRFFAGGDYSIRGFAYKSLSPEDSQGNVVGGKHLLTASLEYEQPLTEKWSAAVFYDTGNAFDRFRPELAEGAGFGFRRSLIFGWLRIDLAQAISRKNRPWRVHLTLGPDL